MVYRYNTLLHYNILIITRKCVCTNMEIWVQMTELKVAGLGTGKYLWC